MFPKNIARNARLEDHPAFTKLLVLKSHLDETKKSLGNDASFLDVVNAIPEISFEDLNQLSSLFFQDFGRYIMDEKCRASFKKVAHLFVCPKSRLFPSDTEDAEGMEITEDAKSAERSQVTNCTRAGAEIPVSSEDADDQIDST